MQPIDKQSLLDSGILCCLILILNTLLGPDVGNKGKKVTTYEDTIPEDRNFDGDLGPVRRLEVPFFLYVTFYVLAKLVSFST